MADLVNGLVGKGRMSKGSYMDIALTCHPTWVGCPRKPARQLATLSLRRLGCREVVGVVFTDEALSNGAWSGRGTRSGAQAVPRNTSDAWSATITGILH